MAQLLQHQESALYGKELQGCRWGILQFFGFRRRLWSTKMLSDKKHGQGKSGGGNRRRSSYAPLKNEDSGIVDVEKNTEVTRKQKASKKSSGKASLRSLILRKLYGSEGQKEKMLPVAPKLLRTISIHYLESNEYVLDGEATSSGDSSSHSTTLSMQNATNTNFHHGTSSTPDGCDSDTSSSFLIKRGQSRVNRKSHRSISMDGVLHKVPYGKVSGDVISEELPRSASATYDRDGLKPYIGPAAKRHVNQAFRRSRSLTESLESYSRLLDSIASSESKRMLTISKSTRDHSLVDPGVKSSFQRTSNAEFDENLVTPEDALASHVSEKNDVDGDVKVAVDESSSDEIAGGSGNLSLFEEYISDKKCDAAVSTEADSCAAPSPSEVVDISEEQAATCDHSNQVFSLTEVDLGDARSTSEEVDIPEEHADIRDNGRIRSSTEVGSCNALPSKDDKVAEEHTTISHDNQMHSFHISKPIEDTSLKPRILHLNDAEVSIGIDVVQESDFDDLNGLKIDTTHKVELNYVKDLFKKSSFSNEIMFDEWYSQNITALQEEECQHYEAAAAAFDFTDMSADQLLLFDLTNEALLDIYKKYSVCKSKLSWFSSFDKPKPVGHLVLKELWSKVSCRLEEQSRPSIEVDMILSSDLAKSDRWMNFHRDADRLGNKLADFVFDKLLTELILQLAEF
ncbi:uncharacterized protein LOC133896476 isoform X3 [Phragmites australis]|uniref:uncharacterized protein LOC133896476 isoform X3 n=1 Tax=Phragmites australis TaxID=29695 RepID=UPI002D77B0D0|nr:uncharacterized protein LOC133896476 isoform X3 [Phragmites australis]